MSTGFENTMPIKTGTSLTEEGLRRFLNAFYRWRESAQGPGQLCSRSRVLFVCLLIRFGGLRLGEALAFNDKEDLLAESSRIRVRGKWARELPLPPSGMKKLMELAESACLAKERSCIARLDQGYPSVLRHFREGELLRSGVPLAVVGRFLGKPGKNMQPSPQDMTVLEDSFLHWERERHIGMYNSFFGRVESVDQGSFSSRVLLVTEGGLRLHVHCSNRTVARLGVQPGQKMNATLRMLDLRFASGEEGGGNMFCGQVQNIVWGSNEVKATFALPGGVFLRSIFDRAEFEALNLDSGDSATLFAAVESFMLSVQN